MSNKSSATHSTKDESALMEALWSPEIRLNPEAFVMYAYPWGEKGTPLEHKTGPRRWQRAALKRIALVISKNHFLFSTAQLDLMTVLKMARVSGRGIGKSALISWLSHWFISCQVGASVIVSANSKDQLEQVTWGELTVWFTLGINYHWFDVTSTAIAPKNWLTTLVQRDLKIGTRYWRVDGKLWSEEKPDSYAGVHNQYGVLLIFDEASGIPDSIWSVASGFFTDKVPNRIWVALGNGRRNTGQFYECFHEDSWDWEGDNIDGRDVEDTDKGFYDRIIRKYGADSFEARVEVMGLFPKSEDDQFISPDLIDRAINRVSEIQDDEPIIMGVDPSKGDDLNDKIRVYLRQGTNVLKRKTYNLVGEESPTMALVALLIDDIRQYKPDVVNIDQGGLGLGVVDRLKEMRYREVIGVSFNGKTREPLKYLNRRSEMYDLARDWLREGRGSLAMLDADSRKSLKSDLVGIRRLLTSDGVLQLEGKKEIRKRLGHSPDDADAFVLTFANKPKAYRAQSKEAMERKKERVQKTGYTGQLLSRSNHNWMSH